MRSISLDYYAYVDELLKPEDIHQARTASSVAMRVGQALILSIVLTLVHGVLLYLALNETIGAGLYLLVHIIVSAIIVVVAYAQYKAASDVPFLVLLAISSSVAGVFGAFGSLLCIVLYGLFRRKSIEFQDWFALIFPPDLISQPERIFNQITVGMDENPKPYDVTPFMTVMEIGSENQKRLALSKMTMRFHPRLAPAFLRALRDPSNAIRVQAATSVAKIEAQFMAKLEKIDKARDLQPGNTQLLFALASFFDDYAHTGLLDKEREVINREKAIANYKAYLQHDPNHAGAWAAIGRLLFRSQQWDEAISWFQNAFDRNLGSDSMMLWYMECLYRTGDYATLRDVIRRHGATLKDQQGLPSDVSDMLNLWTQS